MAKKRNVILARDPLINIDEEKYILNTLFPFYMKSKENENGDISRGFELFKKATVRYKSYSQRLRRGGLCELCTLTKVPLKKVITDLNAWFYSASPDKIHPCEWSCSEDEEMNQLLEGLNSEQLNYIEKITQEVMPDFCREIILEGINEKQLPLVSYMNQKRICRGGDDYYALYGIKRRHQHFSDGQSNGRVDTVLLANIPNLCRDFQLSPHWVFSHSTEFVVLAKTPEIERVMDQFVVLSSSAKKMLLAIARSENEEV